MCTLLRKEEIFVESKLKDIVQQSILGVVTSIGRTMKRIFNSIMP